MFVMLKALKLLKNTSKPNTLPTCRLRLSTSSMEGPIPTQSGAKRPLDSPSTKDSPNKRSNFVTMSPFGQLTNVKTPSDRPFRLSVEGNIGAGKSEFINYFQRLPGIETYPEPIDAWRDLNGHNLLSLMYSDSTQWLNIFQSYVQLTRLQLQTSKPSNASVRVQMFERSLQNNRYCFLEHAYRNGTLHEADYSVLDHWYRYLRSTVDIDLDLIVYLKSAPEVVFERVKQRGRPEENDISLEFLRELHESHERWLMSEDSVNTIPVLVLDANLTKEQIVEQYKKNENRILGYDKTGEIPVKQDQKDRVKKALNLDN